MNQIPEHKTRTTSVGSYYEMFRAVCDCGWRSPLRHDYEQCDADAACHLADYNFELVKNWG